MAANSWLDSIYYMADYYFFEPQHIFKKKIEGKTGGKYRALVNENVRRLEVPLNVCFNVLMRLLPDSITASLCELAESSEPIRLNGNCKFVNQFDIIGNVNDFIQPDAVLDYYDTRIYIELKVDASITLHQITKYMYFHEEWNRRSVTEKKMVLLIISPKSLSSAFQAKEREQIFKSEFPEVVELKNYLNEFDASQHNKRSGVDLSYLDTMVKALPENMTVAHMTWNQVADHLDANNNSFLTNLIGDFVLDIRSRQFNVKKKADKLLPGNDQGKKSEKPTNKIVGNKAERKMKNSVIADALYDSIEQSTSDAVRRALEKFFHDIQNNIIPGYFFRLAPNSAGLYYQSEIIAKKIKIISIANDGTVKYERNNFPGYLRSNLMQEEYVVQLSTELEVFMREKIQMTGKEDIKDKQASNFCLYIPEFIDELINLTQKMENHIKGLNSESF